MKNLLVIITASIALLSCAQSTDVKAKNPVPGKDMDSSQVAYFASGCFWCVEGVYESVEGVLEVESGYSGGHIENPTYEEVCTGKTGHAETVKVYYDSTKVSYKQLVEVFFGSHDPTTLNKQGPDSGTQYRSAIFYENDAQKKVIDSYIAELKKDLYKNSTITTEVTRYTAFYKAEDYHQDFERRNPNNSYVQGVSVPRIEKFKSKYPDWLKK
jgi:peptide-methionine (S)-S-oxide reductase